MSAKIHEELVKKKTLNFVVAVDGSRFSDRAGIYIFL